MTIVKPKVLAISSPKWSGDEYLAAFEEQFDIVEPGNRKTTIANLKAKVAVDGPYDALLILMGIGPYEPFDEELLKPLTPHLKLIASASAGYNEFGIEWMSRNGITFCNSRNAVNEATADMAILMMLGILRDVQGRASSIAQGTWRGLTNGVLMPTRDPSGLKLGIVGLGSIGKHVARKARAFNMEVVYHQRTQLSPDDEKIHHVSYRPSLHSLLSEADVITLHFPLSAETTGMIAHREFSLMKDGVFLINTCRGPVIDEEALIEALKSGKVARAGLDVHHNEPNINPYFIRNDRIIIQPHMGGLTDVSWQRSYREAMENVKAFFSTGKAISPVNADRVTK
ncbi:hypothetical protein LTR22_010348 [Elasticomyces elasticus]|nr:hypothetical protein LTR22_010348 [Elasticomyces elasticus]